MAAALPPLIRVEFTARQGTPLLRLVVKEPDKPDVDAPLSWWFTHERTGSKPQELPRLAVTRLSDATIDLLMLHHETHAGVFSLMHTPTKQPVYEARVQVIERWTTVLLRSQDELRLMGETIDPFLAPARIRWVHHRPLLPAAEKRMDFEDLNRQLVLSRVFLLQDPIDPVASYVLDDQQLTLHLLLRDQFKNNLALDLEALRVLGRKNEPFQHYTSWAEVRALNLGMEKNILLAAEYNFETELFEGQRELLLEPPLHPALHDGIYMVQVDRSYDRPSESTWQTVGVFEVQVIDSDLFALPEELAEGALNWNLDDLQHRVQLANDQRSLEILGGSTRLTFSDLEYNDQETEEVELMIQHAPGPAGKTRLRWYVLPSPSNKTDLFGSNGEDERSVYSAWQLVPKRLRAFRQYIEDAIEYANDTQAHPVPGLRLLWQPISDNSTVYLTAEDVREALSGARSGQLCCVAIEEDLPVHVFPRYFAMDTGEDLPPERFPPNFKDFNAAVRQLDLLTRNKPPYYSLASATNLTELAFLYSMAKPGAPPANLNEYGREILDWAIRPKAGQNNLVPAYNVSTSVGNMYPPILVPCVGTRRILQISVIRISERPNPMTLPPIPSSPGSSLLARRIRLPPRNKNERLLDNQVEEDPPGDFKTILSRARETTPLSETSLQQNPAAFSWIIPAAENRLRVYKWWKQLSAEVRKLIRAESSLDAQQAARILGLYKAKHSETDAYWVRYDPENPELSLCLAISPGQTERGMLFTPDGNTLSLLWIKDVITSSAPSLKDVVHSILFGADDSLVYYLYQLHQEHLRHDFLLHDKDTDLSVYLGGESERPLRQVLAEMERRQHDIEVGLPSTQLLHLNATYEFQNRVLRVFYVRLDHLHEIMYKHAAEEPRLTHPSIADIKTLPQRPDLFDKLTSADQQFIKTFFHIPSRTEEIYGGPLYGHQEELRGSEVFPRLEHPPSMVRVPPSLLLASLLPVHVPPVRATPVMPARPTVVTGSDIEASLVTFRDSVRTIMFSYYLPLNGAKHKAFMERGTLETVAQRASVIPIMLLTRLVNHIWEQYVRLDSSTQSPDSLWPLSNPLDWSMEALWKPEDGINRGGDQELPFATEAQRRIQAYRNARYALRALHDTAPGKDASVADDIQEQLDEPLDELADQLFQTVSGGGLVGRYCSLIETTLKVNNRNPVPIWRHYTVDAMRDLNEIVASKMPTVDQFTAILTSIRRFSQALQEASVRMEAFRAGRYLELVKGSQTIVIDIGQQLEEQIGQAEADSERIGKQLQQIGLKILEVLKGIPGVWPLSTDEMATHEEITRRIQSDLIAPMRAALENIRNRVGAYLQRVHGEYVDLLGQYLKLKWWLDNQAPISPAVNLRSGADDLRNASEVANLADFRRQVELREGIMTKRWKDFGDWVYTNRRTTQLAQEEAALRALEEEKKRLAIAPKRTVTFSPSTKPGPSGPIKPGPTPTPIPTTTPPSPTPTPFPTTTPPSPPVPTTTRPVPVFVPVAPLVFDIEGRLEAVPEYIRDLFGRTDTAVQVYDLGARGDCWYYVICSAMRPKLPRDIAVLRLEERMIAVRSYMADRAEQLWKDNTTSFRRQIEAHLDGTVFQAWAHDLLLVSQRATELPGSEWTLEAKARAEELAAQENDFLREYRTGTVTTDLEQRYSAWKNEYYALLLQLAMIISSSPDRWDTITGALARINPDSVLTLSFWNPVFTAPRDNIIKPLADYMRTGGCLAEDLINLLTSWIFQVNILMVSAPSRGRPGGNISCAASNFPVSFPAVIVHYITMSHYQLVAHNRTFYWNRTQDLPPAFYAKVRAECQAIETAAITAPAPPPVSAPPILPSPPVATTTPPATTTPEQDFLKQLEEQARIARENEQLRARAAEEEQRQRKAAAEAYTPPPATAPPSLFRVQVIAYIHYRIVSVLVATYYDGNPVLENAHAAMQTVLDSAAVGLTAKQLETVEDAIRKSWADPMLAVTFALFCINYNSFWLTIDAQLRAAIPKHVKSIHQARAAVHSLDSICTNKTLWFDQYLRRYTKIGDASRKLADSALSAIRDNVYLFVAPSQPMGRLLRVNLTDLADVYTKWYAEPLAPVFGSKLNQLGIWISGQPRFDSTNAVELADGLLVNTFNAAIKETFDDDPFDTQFQTLCEKLVNNLIVEPLGKWFTSDPGIKRQWTQSLDLLAAKQPLPAARDIVRDKVDPRGAMLSLDVLLGGQDAIGHWDDYFSEALRAGSSSGMTKLQEYDLNQRKKAPVVPAELLTSATLVDLGIRSLMMDFVNLSVAKHPGGSTWERRFWSPLITSSGLDTRDLVDLLSSVLLSENARVLRVIEAMRVNSRIGFSSNLGNILATGKLDVAGPDYNQRFWPLVFAGGDGDDAVRRPDFSTLENMLHGDVVYAHRLYFVGTKYLAMVRGNFVGLEDPISQLELVVKLAKSWYEEVKADPMQKNWSSPGTLDNKDKLGSFDSKTVDTPGALSYEEEVKTFITTRLGGGSQIATAALEIRSEIYDILLGQNDDTPPDLRFMIHPAARTTTVPNPADPDEINYSMVDLFNASKHATIARSPEDILKLPALATVEKLCDERPRLLYPLLLAYELLRVLQVKAKELSKKKHPDPNRAYVFTTKWLKDAHRLLFAFVNHHLACSPEQAAFGWQTPLRATTPNSNIIIYDRLQPQFLARAIDGTAYSLLRHVVINTSQLLDLAARLPCLASGESLRNILMANRTRQLVVTGPNTAAAPNPFLSDTRTLALQRQEDKWQLIDYSSIVLLHDARTTISTVREFGDVVFPNTGHWGRFNSATKPAFVQLSTELSGVSTYYLLLECDALVAWLEHWSAHSDNAEPLKDVRPPSFLERSAVPEPAVGDIKDWPSYWASKRAELAKLEESFKKVFATAYLQLSPPGTSLRPTDYPKNLGEYLKFRGGQIDRYQEEVTLNKPAFSPVNFKDALLKSELFDPLTEELKDFDVRENAQARTLKPLFEFRTTDATKEIVDRFRDQFVLAWG
jgi:hypothetical protein